MSHNKFVRLSGLFGMLSLLLHTGSAMALPTDTRAPVDLSADYAEIDNKRKVNIYRGNVELVQGTIRINADRVEVRQDPNTKVIRSKLFGKPARFSQKLDQSGARVRASGRVIEYDTKTSILVLRNKAEIVRGKDRIRSNEIRYHLNEDRVIASNRDKPGRVRITLEPQQK